MRILHTSDLHIGHALYGNDRREETEEMLRWLAGIIREEGADVLLMAGDIFDRNTPGNEAQQMYYNFLKDVRLSTPCRHIVVIAGNHDSPSLIDAPREFAEALDVVIVGQPAANGGELDREVKILRDRETGAPEMLVCAIPYISEPSLRAFAAWVRGEQEEGGAAASTPPQPLDRDRRAAEGMKAHYCLAAELALKKRRELGRSAEEKIPIVAMGHLATSHCTFGGGEIIGSLLAFDPGEIFSDAFSYVALGHIHRGQVVSRRENWRFSGSPMKLDFGEGEDQSVCVADFDGSRFKCVKTIPVPAFRSLVSIKGSLEDIKQKLRELMRSSQSSEKKIWCSAVQTQGDPTPNFRTRLESLTQGSQVEILLARIELGGGSRQALTEKSTLGERLSDLEPREVFRRLLACRGFTDENSQNFKELMATFNEALALREEDLEEEI